MICRPLSVLTVILAWPLVPAGAEDTVYLATGSGGGPAKVSGQIVDYTGRELRLEIPGGRQETFPAEQVVSVQTQYGREQVLADEAFAQRRFDQALALYREAAGSEPRQWVRRRIIAQLVWCYQALRQPGPACETFLLLVRSDPDTPDIACIPLAWAPSQPSASLEQSARQWLARQDLPAAVLLGASHLLLSTSDGASALARLKQLTSAPDRRIAQLAQAQVWRTALTTADQRQLDDWDRAIGQMPESLRAGPYYMLGQARAYRQQWEQAALALLRVPVVYPQHRELAARALLDAGRSLEKLGTTEDAARLYRELIETYPEAGSVAEARSRLEEMLKAGR